MLKINKPCQSLCVLENSIYIVGLFTDLISWFWKNCFLIHQIHLNQGSNESHIRDITYDLWPVYIFIWTWDRTPSFCPSNWHTHCHFAISLLDVVWRRHCPVIIIHWHVSISLKQELAYIIRSLTGLSWALIYSCLIVSLFSARKIYQRW